MEAAITVDQDLLGPEFWGLASLTVAKTMNHVSNKLCPDSTPLALFEGKQTDVSRQFKCGYGQAVICTRTGQKTKDSGTPRNEFGVVVMPGHSHNDSVFVYFPERGKKFISPRFHVRPISLGAKAQMSLEDGKKYLPYLGDDGLWHITTRGETGPLAKAFADTSVVDIRCEKSYNNDNMITKDFDSSITADEVFTKLAADCKTAQEASTPTLNISHRKEGEYDLIIQPDEEIIQPPVNEQSTRRFTRSSIGRISTQHNDTLLAKAHRLFAAALTRVGCKITSQQTEPDLSTLMAMASISHDEHMRQNPKWSKAKCGPDKDRWLTADKAEADQMFDISHTTMLLIPEGAAGVPEGLKIYPIKRHCKI